MKTPLSAAALAIPLSACLPSGEEVELDVDPNAECDMTLMDVLENTFGAKIIDGIDEDSVPLVDVHVNRSTFDVPDAVNSLVPGDLDAVGFISYDQSQNGFVTSYLSSDNGNNYFTDVEAGTACSDNSFAYNIDGDTILITGKCDWTDMEDGGPIGYCDGNMYKNCPYKDGERTGYGDDCKVLSGFMSAEANLQWLNLSDAQD